MHTVRIISHKNDRDSRKHFIARIAQAYQLRGDIIVPPNSGSTSQTVLDYDMIGGRTDAVKIIDLDWSADVTVSPNDVFYVRTEALTSIIGDAYSPKHQAALYNSKLAWAASVSALATRLWWTNGLQKPHIKDVNPPKHAVFIDDTDAPAPWFSLIRERFGITNAVQSTRMLLVPLDTRSGTTLE